MNDNINAERMIIWPLFAKELIREWETGEVIKTKIDIMNKVSNIIDGDDLPSDQAVRELVVAAWIRSIIEPEFIDDIEMKEKEIATNIDICIKECSEKFGTNEDEIKTLFREIGDELATFIKIGGVHFIDDYHVEPLINNRELKSKLSEEYKRKFESLLEDKRELYDYINSEVLEYIRRKKEVEYEKRNNEILEMRTKRIEEEIGGYARNVLRVGTEINEAELEKLINYINRFTLGAFAEKNRIAIAEMYRMIHGLYCLGSGYDVKDVDEHDEKFVELLEKTFYSPIVNEVSSIYQWIKYYSDNDVYSEEKYDSFREVFLFEESGADETAKSKKRRYKKRYEISSKSSYTNRFNNLFNLDMKKYDKEEMDDVFDIIGYIEDVYNINFFMMIEKTSPDVIKNGSARNKELHQAYILFKSIMMSKLDLLDVIKLYMKIYLLDSVLRNMIETCIYSPLDEVVDSASREKEFFDYYKYNLDEELKRLGENGEKNIYKDILAHLLIEEIEFALKWRSHIEYKSKIGVIKMERKQMGEYVDLRKKAIFIKPRKMKGDYVFNVYSNELGVTDEDVWEIIRSLIDYTNDLEELNIMAYKLLMKIPFYSQMIEKDGVHIAIFILAMQICANEKNIMMEPFKTYKGREDKEKRSVSVLIDDKAKLDDIDISFMYNVMERQYYSNCGYCELYDAAMQCRCQIQEMLVDNIHDENVLYKINIIKERMLSKYKSLLAQKGISFKRVFVPVPSCG